jgi:hypothetical protein
MGGRASLSLLHPAARLFTKARSGMLEVLARKYLADVRVIFEELPENVAGQIWKSGNVFIIGIDRGKQICPNQFCFTLLHEVGHALLGHVRYGWCGFTRTERLLREGAANDFAIAAGKFDEKCQQCISENSKVCLKKWKIKTNVK